MSLERYPTMEILAAEERARKQAQLDRIEEAVKQLQLTVEPRLRIAELEAALRAVVKAWDAEQFMRTGDVHTNDCGCLRCAMDDAAALLPKSDI